MRILHPRADHDGVCVAQAQSESQTRMIVRFALKDTLCRCAGYPTIENAILAAAKSLRTGEPVRKPNIPDSIHQHKSVGHTHLRHDGVDKVTARQSTPMTLCFDGMLYAKAKRAMIPHGFLTKLDISKAKALPGVVAVLTAEDIPAEHNHGLVIYDWPVMVGVGERVRYVGDAMRDRRGGNAGDRRAGVGFDRSGVRPPACHHKSQCRRGRRASRKFMKREICSSTSRSARAIWTKVLPKRM